LSASQQENIFIAVKNILNTYASSIAGVDGLVYEEVSPIGYAVTHNSDNGSTQNWKWILPTFLLSAFAVSMLGIIAVKKREKLWRDVVNRDSANVDSVNGDTKSFIKSEEKHTCEVLFPVKAVGSIQAEDVVVVGEAIYNYDTLGQPFSIDEENENMVQRMQLLREYNIPDIDDNIQDQNEAVSSTQGEVCGSELETDLHR
jgi:hypothetical protein